MLGVPEVFKDDAEQTLQRSAKPKKGLTVFVSYEFA